MRARAEDSLRGLLEDPPLRDRLTWRGLLEPKADEDSTPALMASTLGLLFSAGAGVATLMAALDLRMVEDRALMWAVGLVSAILALVCLIGYRRLSRRFFVAAMGVGIALTVAAAVASVRGTGPIYSPVLAITVVCSLVLFRFVAAAGLTVLATIAYGGLVFARGNPYDMELLLSTTAMIVAFAVVIGVLRRREASIQGALSSVAMTDGLTGLPNRRSFDQRIEIEWQRAARYDSALGLIVIDLDRFKAVNDTYGHEAGDQVLIMAARTLADSVRSIDFAARVGGEEFAVILPDADAGEAARVAERMRKTLRARSEAGPVAITASFGVSAERHDRVEPVELYRRADEALYEAKRSGRDCTALYESEDAIRIVGGGTAVGRLRQLF